MPLTAGVVTISDSGAVTYTPASSLARTMYDNLVANIDDTQTPGINPAPSIPAAPDGVGIRRGFAFLATQLASAIVTYVSANAVVTTTVSAGGLQRDNTGGNPATLAPAAPVNITGTIG